MLDGSSASGNTLTLANSTNSYTGSTTVSGGTLLLGSDNALGQTSNLIINSGTTANINGKTQTIGALNGSGILNINSGNLSVVNGGTFTGIIAGTGAFNLGSGTLTLTGDNTYTGSTSLAGGTLTIGDGGTTGNYAGNIGLANDGSVVFNRSDDLTYAAIISGEGSLVKEGTGVLTLTGENNYTGDTTISAGTLQIGDGDTTGTIAGNVMNNGILAFNRGDALTYSGIISGSGGVTQMGADTVTLTGANTYTGGTLIQTGALNLATATAAGSGDIDISGGQLQLDFSGDALANNLVGLGATQVLGSDITLSGNNSGYTGAWGIVTGASANIGEANNLGSGAVNVNGSLNIMPTSGNYSFTNVLTGAGLVNVALANGNDTFAFGAGVGNGFTGTLQLGQSSFDLTSTNTSVLANATLALASGSMANLTVDRTLGQLTLMGGTLNVLMSNPTTANILTVGHLDVDTPAGSPSAVSTINLSALALPPSSVTGNFLDQDDASTNNGIQVVKATTVSTSGVQTHLTINGSASVDETYDNTSDGYGNTDISATYGYMGVSSSNTALLEGPGLYISYVLKTLETKTNLVLNTAGATDTNLGAQLTGVGNVEYRANNGVITLLNSTNDYQGQSLVSSGTLVLGANNVLGNTRELMIATGAMVDINAKSQSIGFLSTQLGSTLNLNGGALTITSGGTSDGSLTGEGTLNLAGGTTLINGSNVGLSTDVNIASNAMAEVNHVQGLGQGKIANAGTLTFVGANGNVVNQMTGAGALNLTGSNVSLRGDNHAFTGQIMIDANSHLMATAANQLGQSSIVDQGGLTLTVVGSGTNWNLVNPITGAGELIKQGAGTLVIDSIQAHTGKTTINEGTLLVQSQFSGHASLASSEVAINSNGTLGGGW